MEELRCNIVLMKGSRPKVLRLNLECSNELQTPFFSAASSPRPEIGNSQDHRMKHSTPVSSPEETKTSYEGTTEENSLLSPGTVTSLCFVYEQNPDFDGLNGGKYTPITRQNDLDGSLSALDMDNEGETTLSTTSKPSVTSNHKSVFWIPQNHIIDEKDPATINHKNAHPKKSPTTKSLLDRFLQFNEDKMVGPGDQSRDRNFVLNSSIREEVSLGRTSSIPPPLCSLCQHKAPTFGKPPRRFAYEELEDATGGFADINFLAEGGFGLVHRGVLRDGQVIAVKQLKFSGCQGDADFCREVRVLSCAQHRNVVMLIGFCIESKKEY